MHSDERTVVYAKKQFADYRAARRFGGWVGDKESPHRGMCAAGCKQVKDTFFEFAG
jgi:hypothetical protein